MVIQDHDPNRLAFWSHCYPYLLLNSASALCSFLDVLPLAMKNQLTAFWRIFNIFGATDDIADEPRPYRSTAMPRIRTAIHRVRGCEWRSDDITGAT
ncbi:MULTISPECIES: hypothetical protein [Burkholderia]|uniref:hypothetical protein n=1 Tax=Burkholderia TaxID=32008 RepID=UPI00142D26D0|nr:MULTISPECIES: hypothetical protein [Burkholderia]MBY4696573.1 hypothetical protein [Burkholderia latens]MCA8312426.1 hypothetical protein [Burkholderia sp. AU28942]